MEDRDPETEDFLRRVENLDSKREKPVVKKKGEHLKKITKDHMGNESDNELSYKSAYNFEKSFGSKVDENYVKKISESNDEKYDNKTQAKTDEGDKKFVISEEDYLLLQKIKNAKNTGKDDHISEAELKSRLASKDDVPPSRGPKPPVPAKGRTEKSPQPLPRRERKPLELPLRHEISPRLEEETAKKSKTPISPNEPPSGHTEIPSRPLNVPIRKIGLPTRDAKPIDLPSRNSKPTIIPDRHSKPKYNETENTSDEGTPPPLPTRNIPLESSKVEYEENETPPPMLPRRAYKEIQDDSEKNKPPLPRKPNNLTNTVSVESESNNLSSEKPSAPKKPSYLSDTKNTEHISYLKSLEKNKLTKTNSSSESKLVEIKPTKDIDFLDSVQLKSPEQSPSKTLEKQTSPISIKTHDKDSFISSVMKSEDQKPTPTGNKKPAIPPKSANLLKKTISQDSLEKKQKPAIPPKNIDQIVIKKKTLAEKEDTEFQKITLKKRTPPEVSARKPSIPEALLKANTLSKGQISNEEKVADIPEALKKREILAKEKKAPPVPQRKISMPEALKKAEELKNKGSTNNSENQSDVSSSESSEEPQDINSRLEAVLRKAKTSSQLVKEEAPMKLPERASTTGDLLSTKSHSTLTHPNKTRTRGPKRKPPKKLQ